MNFTIYTDVASKVITTVFSIMLIGVLSIPFIDKTPMIGVYFALALIVAVYVFCFLVRPLEYVINDGELLIKSRLFPKRYEIAEMKTVETVSRNEFRLSRRVFGIGGLFSHRGKLSTRQWGTVISYANGFSDNMVLITFRPGYRILLSPKEEELFSPFLNSQRKKLGLS
jgi:hypothetical protein